MIPVLADNQLADLLNQHAIQPGAVVLQGAVLLLSMFSTLTAVAPHHQEHCTQAIMRPLGLGMTGFALIEIFRLAASAALTGSLGF